MPAWLSRAALHGAAGIFGVIFSSFLSPVPSRAQETQAAAASAADTSCDDAKVLKVYRTSREAKLPDKANPDGAKDVQLSDVIKVEVSNLEALEACSDGKPIILYLNSRAFPGLMAFARDDDGLFFDFAIETKEGSERDPWEQILGEPSWNNRSVDVSVGPLGERPIENNDQRLTLNPVANQFFLGWVVLFLALCGAFIWLMRSTEVAPFLTGHLGLSQEA